MNASPEREWQNPWEKWSEFAPVGTQSLLLSLVIVFLCALAIPVAFFQEEVALLILAALFFYVVISVRAPFAVALLLGTVFLVTDMTNSLAAGAVVLALVVGIGATSFLMTAMNAPWVILLFPASAFCFAFAVLWDWKISLLAFAFLPAALLLAIATRRGETRTTAICFAMAGLLAGIAAAIGYYLYTGSAAMEISVSEYVEVVKDRISELILNRYDQRMTLVQEIFGTEAAVEAMGLKITDEYVESLVGYCTNVFPALCCCFCGIIAFEAQILLNGLYRKTGWKQVLTPQSVIFTMSLPAAIIYFVTFLITLVPLEVSMATMVLVNLNVILFPGFCVIGFTVLMLSFASSNRGARGFWTLLLVGGLFCAPSTALSLVALFGANSVVLGAAHQKMKNKQGD